MKGLFRLLAAAAAGVASGGALSAQNPIAVSIPAPPPAQPPAALPPASDAGGSFDALQTIAGCPCPEQGGAPPAPPPFGGPLLERQKLLGDWGGARSRLRERGITLDMYSTNFYNGIANGGVQETFKYRGRVDYLLHVDGEKAGLWKGSFVDLHAESVFGDTINPFAGTFSPLSLPQALPVATGSTTALTGVKFTQALSESFIVYVGKINLLDNFNQPFTGGGRGVDGFQNASLLFNPIFARTVPYSTLGGGFAYLKDLQPVLTFNVLDTFNTPTRDGFDTLFDNGVLLLATLNLPTKFFGLPGHQGLTGTYSSGRYTSLERSAFINPILGTGAAAQKTGSWSLAYNFDQALYVAPDNPNRSWGVFGNLGLADVNPSPFRWFASIGFGGSSPLPCRKLDTVGIGYYYLGLNDSLKQLAPRLLPLRDEQGVEAYYNAAVTPWFHVTPDLQLILPGQNRAQSTLALGLRAKIDF